MELKWTKDPYFCVAGRHLEPEIWVSNKILKENEKKIIKTLYIKCLILKIAEEGKRYALWGTPKNHDAKKFRSQKHTSGWS